MSLVCTVAFTLTAQSLKTQSSVFVSIKMSILQVIDFLKFHIVEVNLISLMTVKSIAD